MKIRTSILYITLALLPLTLSAAENAGFDENSDSRPQRNVIPDSGINNLTSQQPNVSRRQASNIASDRYEGRVLSIRMDNNNWRVRMDREGTVFNVFVNASSGDVSASTD